MANGWVHSRHVVWPLAIATWPGAPYWLQLGPLPSLSCGQRATREIERKRERGKEGRRKRGRESRGEHGDSSVASKGGGGARLWHGGAKQSRDGGTKRGRAESGVEREDGGGRCGAPVELDERGSEGTEEASRAGRWKEQGRAVG